MKLRASGADRVAVFAAASRLLQYPDEALLDCLPTIEQILQPLPAGARTPLLAFVRHLKSTPLLELQAAYVETFDLRQRNCMHLTFPQAGDTRRRGMALWRFGDLYRRRGYSLASGELPDFLPALLELAAQAGPEDAEPFELLVRYRPEIAVLRSSLQADQSPYAALLHALEFVLPKPGPAVLEAARRLAEEGPPEEQVGIAPDFRWQAPEAPETLEVGQ